MDKLHSLQVFVEVAKQQSFVAASQQLGLSAPATTRAIAALEAKLGVTLFNRTTRHVRLTEAGSQYLEDCKRNLESLDEADAAVMGQQTQPKGTLTITAPILFGTQHVMPIVTEYLSQHLNVDINTIFSDSLVNLVEDDIDIAVRIGRLKDSSLYATKVGEVSSVVCASPAYLAQHGMPAHPSELSQHRIIATTAVSPQPSWSFNVERENIAFKITPRLRTNQNAAALKAAQSGLGITQLMSYQIGKQVREGSLIRLLTKFEQPPIPVSIVRVDGRRMTAKVRTFLDLASQRLRENQLINSY